MIRTNHYEVAFEAYLRELRTAYVSVDERRRTLLQDASLKSMDFIVYSKLGPNLLVDVKGRKFQKSAHWENWVTQDDLKGLTQWEQVFGDQFRSLFVFAYELSDPRPENEEISAEFHWQSRCYTFYGIWVDEYQKLMQRRSLSWQTVWIPRKIFQNNCFPLRTILSSSLI